MSLQLSYEERQRLLGRLEVEALFLQHRKGYGRVTVRDYGEEGLVVYVPQFLLPPGWNTQVTAIAVEIPTYSPGYPIIPPTWFYIQTGLQSVDQRLPYDLFLKPGSQFEKASAYLKTFLNDGFSKYGLHMQSWQPVTDPHQNFTRGDSLVSYLTALFERFRLHEGVSSVEKK